MAVFFARIVAGVEDLETGDVDEEHTGTENMSSVIRCEGDPRAWGDVLVNGNCNDKVQRILDIQRRKKSIRGRRRRAKNKVSMGDEAVAKKGWYRTKSCIMNLWRAFVGCVMYTLSLLTDFSQLFVKTVVHTLPLPSLKFVYWGQNKIVSGQHTHFFSNIGKGRSMVKMAAVNA
jgi:hypothetical protein